MSYTEQLLKLWQDADDGPYIEIWEEDLDQPLIEYAPLSALRTRLNVMEGFLHWNVDLNMGSLISELCVDQTLEPLELDVTRFIVQGDIFSPGG